VGGDGAQDRRQHEIAAASIYDGTMPSRRDRPADVIALSPFRAELGRARRLRRADALYEAPDLAAAVRQLPGDELYYVIHELGLADGRELLALATPEQLTIVLDFALWERDQLGEAALGEWLDAMASAPVERIGAWMAGLDSELVGLMLRRGARIYDLTQEEPPDEPEGTLFPTPDGLFALDVVGAGPQAADGPDPVAVLIRLVDAFYRADRALARRMLVGARSELDAELEESAYRWRQARMADLGFEDYYDALEVYRELDPATVRIDGSAPESSRDERRPTGPDVASAANGALRVPTALGDRLRDTTGSRFARAAQKLADAGAIEDLRAALVTLTNRVLAADRVAPGDDDAAAAALDRLAATLDLGLERVTSGDEELGSAALRSVPLVRLFRVGFSLTARVRRLALALRRGGPFGALGFRLAEADDAALLEAIVRPRPMFPRLLDEPPAAGERPFRTLADVGTAAAAVERAAVAQAMLRGLGVTPEDLAPGGPLLEAAGDDEAALDAGLLARTLLVARLVHGEKAPGKLRPLDPEDPRRWRERRRASPVAGSPASPPSTRSSFGPAGRRRSARAASPRRELPPWTGLATQTGFDSHGAEGQESPEGPVLGPSRLKLILAVALAALLRAAGAEAWDIPPAAATAGPPGPDGGAPSPKGGAAAPGPDGGAPSPKGGAAAPASDGGPPSPKGTPGEGFISEVDARVAVAAALGDRLFKLGRYDEAVAEYRHAYELRADPSFLFHIAECYRERGASQQALFYYERYLAAKPDAFDRDEVLDRISELEHPHGRNRSHPRLVIVPEEPPPRPRPPFRPWRRWWFWTALGAAVAVGVTATLLSGSSTPPFPGSELGEKRFY
jgi:hypothetical protein